MKKYPIFSGLPVKTAKYASVALDGGSVANIFRIYNGPVRLLAFVGECTEAVSAHACNMKFVMDPTTGADTDMCLVVDINAMALGSFFYLDGTIGNACVIAVPGTALPLGIGMDIPLILPVGTIDLNLANSNPTSGIADIWMQYIPLVDGAYVVGS